MSRIDALFTRKKERILNVYCTAGFPQFNSTGEVMKALQNNGVDLIELGMPYSDPLADGTIIQESSARALGNGMTIAKLFEQLAIFQKESLDTAPGVPVVLMGYLNPLLQFGFERFCKMAAEVGIDGLIIPDIPMYEYVKEYRDIVEQHGLDFIFLVTPETSEERIREIDEQSKGFIYAVSSSSITGSEKNFSEVTAYLKRLKEMKLKNPVLVGFGIRDKKTFDMACQFANGAIIGSAYIKAIEDKSSYGIEDATKQFIEEILKE